MIKHMIAIIVLSALAVFFIREVAWMLHILVRFYDWVVQQSTVVFAGDHIGQFLQKLLALLLIPIAFSLILGLLYKVIRHQFLPEFLAVLWAAWLVLLTAVALK